MAFNFRIPFFARRGSPFPARFLSDRSALYAVVERERLRTDRNGSPFCLLIFRPEDEGNPPHGDEEQALARFLCSRLRDSDAIGRWQRDIAALLVDTSLAGGRYVAEEAIEASAKEGRRYSAAVKVYPEWAGDEDDEPRDRGTGVSRLRASDRANAGVRRDSGAEAERQTADLERFFLRELTPPIPWWKRSFDVAAAGAGLIALSPLLVLAAAAIRLTSPGPIFFTQLRTGRGGASFTMYKFRTMTVDAESKKAALRALSVQDGPAFKLEHDPRITPIGAILRKSCVDELPQLWNVLRGEMSVVGPRPLPVDEAARCADWQQRRHAALPGLTCYWQALGTARVPFIEWMRLDLRYVRKITPWVDVRLIVRTLTHVVLARASR